MSDVVAPSDSVACQEPTVVTLEEAMQELLNDETPAVTLKGSDGTTVRANRKMLAARSTFFDAMLYGQFRESDMDVIELGFPGDVLRAVVEFVHTDNPEILNRLAELASTEQDEDGQISGNDNSCQAFKRR